MIELTLHSGGALHIEPDFIVSVSEALGFVNTHVQVVARPTPYEVTESLGDVLRMINEEKK